MISSEFFGQSKKKIKKMFLTTATKSSVISCNFHWWVKISKLAQFYLKLMLNPWFIELSLCHYELLICISAWQITCSLILSRSMILLQEWLPSMEAQMTTLFSNIRMFPVYENIFFVFMVWSPSDASIFTRRLRTQAETYAIILTRLCLLQREKPEEV